MSRVRGRKALGATATSLRSLKLVATLVVACARITWRWRIRGDATSVAAARELAHVARRLDGLWVKVGQMLSTRADIFPPPALAALASLRSQLPAVPFNDLMASLSRHDSDSLRDLRIDPRPIGIGCVAQVHLAQRISDGALLAVKIKKPGADLALRHDIAVCRAIAKLFALAPSLRGTPVVEVTEQIAGALLQQLDFRTEAENARKLGALFASDASVRFPTVLPEYSSANLIGMHFEPGLRPFDEALDLAPDANTIAERALSSIYKMIFHHGCVHCDVHPGNMLVDSLGRVVFLDCGLVVAPDVERTDDFREFFLSLALAKEEYAAKVLLKTARVIRADFDRRKFATDLRSLLASASGQSAAGFSVLGFVADIYALLKRHGVRSEHDFTWVLMTLLTFEGLVRRRLPSFDFQGIAVSVILSGHRRDDLVAASVGSDGPRPIHTPPAEFRAGRRVGAVPQAPVPARNPRDTEPSASGFPEIEDTLGSPF